MYEAQYGFTGSPFQLTPDTRFFYGSRGHSRAIAHLTFGLAQGEGFIIVTGEVGAGKTLLVERLISQLDPRAYAVARTGTTQVSGEDLFRLVLAGFGLDDPDASKATLLLRFEDMLRARREAGRRCLLIVDEAQNLSRTALEELRMLSNITAGGPSSLQTVLMGQPQFRRILAVPELDQLRQRVLASYHLGPLSREETRCYVEHRLRTVGWHGGNPGWEDSAFAAVHDHTDGVPRRINRLCGRVLLFGALENSNTISGPMVSATAAELAEDLEGIPPGRLAGLPAPPALPGRRGWGRNDLDLLDRLEALEERMARREHELQRLLDTLGADASGRVP